MFEQRKKNTMFVGYSWEHTISPERDLERELYTLYALSWVDDEDSDRITGGFI
jgi:hypothetical protein